MCMSKSPRLLLAFPALCLASLALANLPTDESRNGAEASAILIEEMIERARQLRTEGKYQEGLELAEEARERAIEANDPANRLQAEYQAALLHYFLQNGAEARARLEVGLGEARQLGMEDIESMYLAARGVFEWREGNLGAARASLEASNAINERLGDQRTLASNLNNLGIIAYSEKDWPTALANYRKAYTALGDLDADDLRASISGNIGECLVQMGQLDEAEPFLNESLQIGLRMNNPHDLGFTYFNLGELHARKGQSEEAIRLYHKALEMQLSLGNDWAAGLTRLRCAEEFWGRKEADQAIEELKAGYEALKAMNAISLLRDYSALFEEIYSYQGKTGLASYYDDLERWFSQRMELENNPIQREIGSLTRPGREPSEMRADSKMIKPVQAATIALLGLLIVVLVVENHRLRKHASRL